MAPDRLDMLWGTPEAPALPDAAPPLVGDRLDLLWGAPGEAAPPAGPSVGQQAVSRFFQVQEAVGGPLGIEAARADRIRRELHLQQQQETREFGNELRDLAGITGPSYGVTSFPAKPWEELPAAAKAMVPFARLAASWEQSVFATAELAWRSVRAGRNLIAGKPEEPGWLDRQVEIMSRPEIYGYATPVAEALRIERKKAYSNASATTRIIGDLGDALPSLAGYISQIMTIRALMPAAPGVTGVVGAGGIATLAPAAEVAAGSPFIVPAVHGFVTTRGNLETRARSALIRVGYNVTPYIVNELGMVGLKAVASDILLNTFLTSPTYVQAWRQEMAKPGKLSKKLKEFAVVAMPQFVIDVGMAWHTRGLPENQRAAALKRYSKRVKGAAAMADKARLQMLDKMRAILEQPNAFARPDLDVAGRAKTVPEMIRDSLPTKTPTPVEKVPTEQSLPKANEPTDAAIGELQDRWKADLDESDARNYIRADQHLTELAQIAGAGRNSRKTQDLAAAIFLYVDLKDKADTQFAKWSDQLTPEQVALFKKSQELSPEARAFGDMLIRENAQMGQEALDAGAIHNVLENYIARIWETPRGKRGAGLFGKFRTRTARAMPRTLESVLEGWARGMKLRVRSAIDAQAVAAQQVSQVIHNRNVIKLGTKGKIFTTDPNLPGYERVEHPNFTHWRYRGTVEEVGEKPARGRGFFITPDGKVLERVPLYAPKELVKDLNRVLGVSGLYRMGEDVGLVSKWNSLLKQTILMSSFFHHAAFLRSYMFASRGLNPFKGYKEGKRAIQNFTPELRDLVRAGLTIGRIQDFSIMAAQQKTAIGKVIDKVPMARETKNALLRMRDANTDFLFNRMGPFLKTQAALLEYRHLLKKYSGDIAAGKMTRQDAAKIAANIANDDFGGLNLRRIGRDPTRQHIFRLLALAPDWTESNVRTMVNAFALNKQGQAYRAFWGRVMGRGVLPTIVLNYLLSLADDETFTGRYQKAWKEGKLRWTDIDITPIYRALGGDDDTRKYFNFIGHLRDPVKFIFHPGRSAKHKGSVFSRTIEEARSGRDWAGRPFTTFGELLGVDEETEGRHQWQLVKSPYARGGPVEYATFPSYTLHTVRGWMPIQVQAGLAFLAGEIDAFDAMTRSVGLATTTTYPQKQGRRPTRRKRATRARR